MDQLTPEDAKIVTLARASRARAGASQGAAVRDLDGRTYTATEVALPSLAIGALDLAVAMAVSSGAKGLEAAAVIGPDTIDTAWDLAGTAVRDLAGPGVPVLVADEAGTVTEVLRT